MSKALVVSIAAAALIALLAYGVGIVAAIGGVGIGGACLVYAGLSPRPAWAGGVFGVALLVAAVAVALLDSGATIAWGGLGL
jgi:hypothetical protein